MEKEKATYAEIEHFYRNRVTKFLPIADAVLEKLGFEVAGVQLNDSFWNTVEVSMNPSDIDPSRETIDKRVKSDFLRRLISGRGVNNYEGVLKEVAESLGISEKTYDQYQLEGHTLIPILFIRPRGSSISFSDLVPVEDLYHSEFYPIKGIKEESPDDWGEDVWEQFDMVICSHEGAQQTPEELPDRDSPQFEFYKALSKSVSWIVNVPLLEALFELGIRKTSSKESLEPGVGEVLYRKEFYIEPLVVMALSKDGMGENFPRKEDVELLVLSLNNALASASSLIVNDEVRSAFISGMRGITSESVRVLFLPSREDPVLSYTNPKLKAISPEELEVAVNEIFDKFGEAYEFLEGNRLVDRVEGVYSKSPMYSIQVEPFHLGFNNVPSPISPSKDNPFSTLLSPLNGVAVEESSHTYRKSLAGHRGFSNRSRYVESVSVVNVITIGPKPHNTEDIGEGEENFHITYSPNDLAISENPSPLFVDFLKPSLDPRFSLHTYLSPLMPALFYYGYALIISQYPKDEIKIDLSVESSFNPKVGPSEGEELDDGFIKSFSNRVLELSDRSLRGVWEGILEERHKKYLEASENFLKVVSPKDDRVSTAVHYRTYRYGNELRRYLTLNLVVKYRHEEDFVSSLKNLLIQAALLLSEIGDGVEVGITFIY